MEQDMKYLDSPLSEKGLSEVSQLELQQLSQAQLMRPSAPKAWAVSLILGALRVKIIEYVACYNIYNI